MEAQGVMSELRGPCCLGKRDVVNVAQLLGERSHAGRPLLAMQTNEDERLGVNTTPPHDLDIVGPREGDERRSSADEVVAC